MKSSNTNKLRLLSVFIFSTALSPFAQAALFTPDPMSDNYYKRLGVSDFADGEELRNAKVRAVKAAHPDLGGSTQAMANMNEAIEVLFNPVAKLAHDERLRRNGTSGTTAENARDGSSRQSRPSSQTKSSAGRETSEPVRSEVEIARVMAELKSFQSQFKSPEFVNMEADPKSIQIFTAWATIDYLFNPRGDKPSVVPESSSWRYTTLEAVEAARRFFEQEVVNQVPPEIASIIREINQFNPSQYAAIESYTEFRQYFEDLPGKMEVHVIKKILYGNDRTRASSTEFLAELIRQPYYMKMVASRITVQASPWVKRARVIIDPVAERTLDILDKALDVEFKDPYEKQVLHDSIREFSESLLAEHRVTLGSIPRELSLRIGKIRAKALPNTAARACALGVLSIKAATHRFF